MAVDSTLANPLDMVRAIIGDTGGTMITDQTIEALLLLNDDNVTKTSLQCIQFIVADLAKSMHEEVGAVKIWASEQYRQYRDLLDDMSKNPAYMGATALHILGGVSKNEYYGNRTSDARHISTKEGGYPRQGYSSITNTYFLDEL